MAAGRHCRGAAVLSVIVFGESMSDSAKQIGIAVGSSILTALILAIAGYVFVVKENQIRIESLEKLVKGQSGKPPLS